MSELDTLQSVPVGAILLLPEEESQRYLSEIAKLSSQLKDLVTSPRTGSYLRGQAKTFKLTTDQTARLALLILQITLGRLPLTRLAAEASSQLQLPNEQASRLAEEIENDLFSSVMLELTRHAKPKEGKGLPTQKKPDPAGGARNVLNLKEQNKPSTPPPIPRPPRFSPPSSRPPQN